MATLYKILTAIFVTVLAGCMPLSSDKAPLIEKDLASEAEKNNTLFAFVGEKLEFTYVPSEEVSFDAMYKAKYKIIQRVYGNYSNDTIEFVAYSHKGVPEFPNYNHVLLFVSESKGKYYHEKYQYFDVYKTKDNRWASSYKSREYRKNIAVKPMRIDFLEPVVYPTIVKYYNNQIDTIKYPEPYYKTVGDSAYAIYGNYLEDLFTLKKEGVLAARGLFEDKNPIEIEVLETQPAVIKRDSTTKQKKIKNR